MKWIYRAWTYVLRFLRFFTPVSFWLRVTSNAAELVCPGARVTVEASHRWTIEGFEPQGMFRWDGGGDPPGGDGSKFTTRFLTGGDKTLTVRWIPDSGTERSTSILVRVETIAGRLYGDYDLQRGDNDSTLRFGGAVRSAAAGDVVPAAGQDGFVKQLQEDLKTLGFMLVGAADGDFGRATEAAVREFQIYARMPKVAGVAGAAPIYADTLAQRANSNRYTNQVGGVANLETRCLIRRWIANSWRCPVVIEAWRRDAQGQFSKTTIVAGSTDNIWKHDEVADVMPRMFVRDLSGYYTLPAARAAEDRIVVGEFSNAAPPRSGQVSEPPRHTWPEAELLPEALVGVSLAALTPEQLSTYKVVRAVSEVECLGFFDCLTAYDRAFISQGPCHWTLGLADPNGDVDAGELCAYLAYLRAVDPMAFDAAIGFFGVGITEDWIDANGIPNGDALFVSGQRKFAAWVTRQQEDGSMVAVPSREVDGNTFKTWHWFYRFVMAGRTIEGYRRRMWHMARVRLRDILSTPWGAGVAPIPLQGGGTRPANVGDVYTSERTIASLHRWHVYSPGQVFSGGSPTPQLRHALAHAGLAANIGDPTTWTDADESKLMNGIAIEAAAIGAAIGDATLPDTVDGVRNWPIWAGGQNPRGFALSPQIGRLELGRNSFRFDSADLPPAP